MTSSSEERVTLSTSQGLGNASNLVKTSTSRMVRTPSLCPCVHYNLPTRKSDEPKRFTTKTQRAQRKHKEKPSLILLCLSLCSLCLCGESVFLTAVSPAAHIARRACQRKPVPAGRCGCSSPAPANATASRPRGRW